MKRLSLVIICAISSAAYAQQSPPPAAPIAPGKSHIVDFDQEFFTRNPFSKWMRDPFKNPPGFAKGPADKSAWPKLESITMKRNKVPFVVLDGKRYREGEFVDETRFVSTIGTNYVILSEGSYDYELVMKTDDKKSSSEYGGRDAGRLPASTESKK